MKVKADRYQKLISWAPIDILYIHQVWRWSDKINSKAKGFVEFDVRPSGLNTRSDIYLFHGPDVMSAKRVCPLALLICAKKKRNTNSSHDQRWWWRRFQNSLRGSASGSLKKNNFHQTKLKINFITYCTLTTINLHCRTWHYLLKMLSKSNASILLWLHAIA